MFVLPGHITFATEQDIFRFLVMVWGRTSTLSSALPETGAIEDDLVFRGSYVTQSEVGNRALKIAVYLRAICCNRIMWGVEGFEEINIQACR